MKKNSLVIYKNFPALTGDIEGDKFSVTWCPSGIPDKNKKNSYAVQKVREKDVILLCDGGVSSLENVLEFEKNCISADGENSLCAQIAEVHELLLSDEETAGVPVPFTELAELIRGNVNADEQWGIYSCLKKTFFFEEIIENENGNTSANVLKFIPRSKEQIEILEKKKLEKEQAKEIQGEFIKRLKQKKIILPEDAKFMCEVESFALGQTQKCSVLKEAGFKETAEKAHSILLETGIWTYYKNPYPSRYSLSTKNPSQMIAPPSLDGRPEIPGVFYAIDSEWSHDPDDAIGFDGEFLWVHIADPASVVVPDSSADIDARGRGATIYLPEKTVRMLNEESLSSYALGLTEKSPALSFKIKLDENYEIESCDVIPTVVTVKRITYEKADEEMDTPELKPLFEIAEKVFARRKKNGAVSIDMPEVHITADIENRHVEICKVNRCKSSDVVREAMILAGEGAAKFAFKNGIPFPFISQDAPEIPAELPDGLAGQYRLRRSMRKRNVSTTPAAHYAMGLSMYSQVTSPLRRYGDLLSHQQLRAFLSGGKLLDRDTVVLRLNEGDSASIATKQAERKSSLHWTLVYLLENPKWQGEAVCLEKQQNQCIFVIPELALETTLGGNSWELNEKVKVRVSSVNLPLLEVSFEPCV